MKAYTDLSQSKKLAEILPLESADMCYRYYSGGMITGYGDCVLAKSFITGRNVIRENDLPCWSLASLLGVLPEGTILLKATNISSVGDIKYHCDCPKLNIDKWFDNPVDACVAMIEKLHELNLL